MPRFRNMQTVIEAITFDEFVEYGKNTAGAHIVNGMPWSFNYKGHPITHENDERYLILTPKGIVDFTPKDMLITGAQGEIYPCKFDIFEKIYELSKWESEVEFKLPEYSILKIKGGATKDNVVLGLVDSGYVVKVKFVRFGIGHEDNHWEVSYK